MEAVRELVGFMPSSNREAPPERETEVCARRRESKRRPVLTHPVSAAVPASTRAFASSRPCCLHRTLERRSLHAHATDPRVCIGTRVALGT
eukprot:656799-Prymnesium_polylepis.2